MNSVTDMTEKAIKLAYKEFSIFKHDKNLIIFIFD
jgi:hypothetical protein